MQYCLLLFWALLIVSAINAQTPKTTRIITIDASLAPNSPPVVITGMGGKSSTGHDIQVNSRYLTFDGKPWLPVMGEFHFSRYPSDYWEEEILKMKAAGIQIISTYVFWIHHEEIEGQFDWTGQRDLRLFAQLCQKHGLFLVVRIGPYAHGEVRNGGLPDWLLQEGVTRRNSPNYMSHVQQFDREISQQLKGLLWKDGGSVIGIQLENEYFTRGEDAGAAHIAELKKLAIAAGLIVPLYTVTGWGDAHYPLGDVLPVYGVYPDDFWSSSASTNPPSEGYRFDLRRDNNTIAPARPTSSGAEEPNITQLPYLLAEAGGGMEVAYHRRPLITASDVAALVITHLGAGANLYGYYMFHGGSNPDGKRTSLQESAAIDRVYDLPVVSYDFQAPLREFGQLNSSYRELKSIQLFLNEFGGSLARMTPYLPETQPASTDLQTPRAAVRAEGNRGYLFFNNYVRDHPMASQRDVQFRITLPSETLVMPHRPVDVPSGEYFIWPFNLDLHGSLLKYASAQLLCSVKEGGEPYYFFSATPGVAPEFAFDERTTASVDTSHAKTSRDGGRIYVSAIEPGMNVALTATSHDGRRAHVVVLTRDQTLNIWKSFLAGQERTVFSSDDVFFDGNTMVLRARDNSKLAFSVFPAAKENPSGSANLKPLGHDGIFSGYSIEIPDRPFTLKWNQFKPTGSSLPVKRGTYNPVAPTDSDFDRAAAWNIDVPGASLLGISDLFLKITYLGDVARLYTGTQLVGDDFYHGELWEVGLKRFPKYGEGQHFVLKIAPLRKDAPIFLTPLAWPNFASAPEIATVQSIALSPEYQVTVRFGQAGAE